MKNKRAFVVFLYRWSKSEERRRKQYVCGCGGNGSVRLRRGSLRVPRVRGQSARSIQMGASPRELDGNDREPRAKQRRRPTSASREYHVVRRRGIPLHRLQHDQRRQAGDRQRRTLRAARDRTAGDPG